MQNRMRRFAQLCFAATLAFGATAAVSGAAQAAASGDLSSYDEGLRSSFVVDELRPPH